MNDIYIPEEHPLINNDSRHYDMVDHIPAISRMEQMYSISDLMAWAKISAMKYRLRIGHKDEPKKEVKKIITYENYYTYLEEILNMNTNSNEEEIKQ